MCEISQIAEKILRESLAEFLANGAAPRLPTPAPGSGIDESAVRKVVTSLTTTIVSTAKTVASVRLAEREVRFSHGWICDRWCSTYLLLKSLLETPAPREALIPVLEPLSEFRWPEGIPVPSVTADPFVVHTNRVIPWVILPTVVHEVAHAIVDSDGKSPQAVEFECDEFAARYLLGKRTDSFAEIVMLGLGVWQCCLCSFALGSGNWNGTTHPNPVLRLQNILRRFVPPSSELGSRVWMLSLAHVIRLARFYERPALDARVLTKNHPSLDELLTDLVGCWARNDERSE